MFTEPDLGQNGLSQNGYGGVCVCVFCDGGGWEGGRFRGVWGSFWVNWGQGWVFSGRSRRDIAIPIVIGRFGLFWSRFVPASDFGRKVWVSRCFRRPILFDSVRHKTFQMATELHKTHGNRLAGRK